jgi:GT2 family glycosyltransferase
VAIDLSVVTATRGRYKHLIRTISQVAAQSTSLRHEHIVVGDGPDGAARAACARAGTRYFEIEAGGAWGAACKDRGVAEARGEYIVFWDDDNDYRPEALAVLHAAAHGHDVGVVRCYHVGLGRPVPSEWAGRFAYGDIDTMCVCVRAAAARAVPWYVAEEAAERGTDYRWLIRLALCGATVRFVPAVIGDHL